VYILVSVSENDRYILGETGTEKLREFVVFLNTNWRAIHTLKVKR